MDNDLPLDVEPTKYGANIWTYMSSDKFKHPTNDLTP